MRKIFIILIVIFLLILSSYSEDNNAQSLTENFREIINIDDNNKKLVQYVTEDEINYRDFFYYYSLVSEEQDKYAEYESWLNDLEKDMNKEIVKEYGNIKITNSSVERQKEVAEKILFILHSKIFKRYRYDANKISEIIKYGDFNCVSSSIIYAVFLLKYGFDFTGIRTVDHAFIKINFTDEQIDVETTNRYGFDPGKNKEILDEFGKVTGFTYVPQNNYRSRTDIKAKDLLLLIYHNFLSTLFKEKNYIKAANLAYIIYTAKKDEDTKRDFYGCFQNYLSNQFDRKKFSEGIADINSFFYYFGLTDMFIDDWFSLLGNYVNTWSDYVNMRNFDEYLLEENARFPSLKDDKKFIEIYLLFIYKCITYYDNTNSFDKSYDAVKRFNGLYKNDEIKEMFKKIMIDEFDYYKKNNDFEILRKRAGILKDQFVEYESIISENEKYYLLNQVYDLFIQKDYLTALKKAKSLLEIFPGDERIKNRLKECYVGISINYYEKKDVENMIKYTEEGLAYFPDDSTLKNNYLAFFKNLINDAENSRDYDREREILDIALKKFPLDNYLKRKKIDLEKK